MSEGFEVHLQFAVFLTMPNVHPCRSISTPWISLLHHLMRCRILKHAFFLAPSSKLLPLRIPFLLGFLLERRSRLSLVRLPSLYRFRETCLIPKRCWISFNPTFPPKRRRATRCLCVRRRDRLCPPKTNKRITHSVGRRRWGLASGLLWSKSRITLTSLRKSAGSEPVGVLVFHFGQKMNLGDWRPTAHGYRPLRQFLFQKF